MLTRLTVRNLAIVEAADVAFGEGLNIITGETGAGKSVLMGALELALGARADAGDLLRAYIARSRAELCGDAPVLGRMKELLTYWCAVPRWKRLWPVVKLCRTVDELLSLIE